MPSRLWDVLGSLIDVALGREKADLVIKGGILVDVYSGEILEDIDVAIKGDRIAYVGDDAEHTIGKDTLVMKARGRYLAPGLIDAHVHVESSMLTLTEFSKAVIPRGTTSIFADPHEICNVLGEYGFKLMIEEASKVPLRVYLQVPSCVPAASLEFETPGAVMDSDIVCRLMKEYDVLALGEMMNYPGVISKDQEVMNKITCSLKLGRVVTGHAPLLRDKELSAYIAAGVSSCHESTMQEEALEKLRLGMYVMVREGSAWKDVKEVIKIITERKVDSRHVLLATDDRHPEDILREGHMDFVVKRAIEEGVEPVKAIQMATLNTAQYYNVERDIGGIAPGRYADIIVLRDLPRMSVEAVVLGGEIAAKEGRLLARIGDFRYPSDVRKTIRLIREIVPSDLKILSRRKEGSVKAHVIKIIEGKTITVHEICELSVVDHVVQPDLDNDIVLASVIERHKGTNRVGKGFVKGLGLKIGAFASSVAHDSHNIVVVGANWNDMAYAVNELRKSGGGMVAVMNGSVGAIVSLPIAGLITDRPIEEVADDIRKLRDVLMDMGCTIKSPFMTISLLALTVIPEIRLSDKGVVDVNKGRIIPPIEED